jgi:hypothetical protein
MNQEAFSKDEEFEVYFITEVKEYTDADGKLNYSLTLRREDEDKGGTGFGFTDTGIKPKVGDECRLCGKGFGSRVRGVTINGEIVYYRTEEEDRIEAHNAVLAQEDRDKKEFEENKDKIDDRIASLPDVFQQRIKRFQGNNPDFCWKYETYELFTCEQAIIIADTLKTDKKIINFIKLPYEKQKKKVPKLDDGHSGNTFGCACLLARVYVNQPELVPKMHGAMSPLVGCLGYGCHTREDFPELKENSENS